MAVAFWGRSGESFETDPNLAGAGVLCLALSGVVRAAEDTPREALDSVKSALSEIDDELKLENLSDGQLAQLRARSEPLAGQLQAVIAELSPRLEASRKRLAELKPKNADATTQQTDPAADELKAEQAKFEKLDADLRSARAALLQVDDYVTRISAERRDIFTKQTFARSQSVLSPLLWLSVAREMPADVSEFRQLIVNAVDRLGARATLGQVGGLSAVLVLLLALAAAAPMGRAPRHRCRWGGAGRPAGCARRCSPCGRSPCGRAAARRARHRLLRARCVRSFRSPAAGRRLGAARRACGWWALAYAFARAMLAPRRADGGPLPIGDDAAIAADAGWRFWLSVGRQSSARKSSASWRRRRTSSAPRSA